MIAAFSILCKSHYLLLLQGGANVNQETGYPRLGTVSINNSLP
jgi:hypothetical protein